MSLLTKGCSINGEGKSNQYMPSSIQVYLSLEIHNNKPWSLHAVGGYFNIVVCSIL